MHIQMYVYVSLNASLSVCELFKLLRLMSTLGARTNYIDIDKMRFNVFLWGVY